MEYYKLTVFQSETLGGKVMKINWLVMLIGFLFLFSCAPADNVPYSKLTGDYLGQPLPGDKPQLFAPGIISTPHTQRDAAFSPDGDIFCWSIRGPVNHTIIEIRRKNNRWQPPQIASFSGKFSDLEPCFAPDGARLYFASNRPKTAGGEINDYDIWYVERNGDAWGEPRNIGAPVNTPGNEFYPSFTRDGTLYFCARRPDAIGGEDLYYAPFTDGAFQPPINLGDSVNTAADEFNAFVHPDGDYILYTSTGWGRGSGGGDLWVSFRGKNGSWKHPENLRAVVNSPKFEYCPSLSPDGQYLFYTSSRVDSLPLIQNYPELIQALNRPQNSSQNIYWVSTAVIEELREH
jgi:Tol biopolymer transport system component